MLLFWCTLKLLCSWTGKSVHFDVPLWQYYLIVLVLQVLLEDFVRLHEKGLISKLVFLCLNYRRGTEGFCPSASESLYYYYEYLFSSIMFVTQGSRHIPKHCKSNSCGFFCSPWILLHASIGIYNGDEFSANGFGAYYGDRFGTYLYKNYKLGTYYTIITI